MEVRGAVNGVTVYDDLANHPTAISATLSGLRTKVGDQRIIAVLQFGSNTMSQGIHRDQLAKALRCADKVAFLRPEKWDINALLRDLGSKAVALERVEAILEHLSTIAQPDDHILIMSNQSFEGIHHRLLKKLQGVPVLI